MADPVTVAVGRMFYRANESLVDITFTGPLVPGGKTMIFKEKADSKNSWYRSGTNADGGVEPAKCLIGEIPPTIAAKLKAYDAMVAGGAAAAATPSVAPGEIAVAVNPTTRTARVL